MAVSTSRPDAPSGAVPRTYFSIWQRLLRGYAPLAVFAVLLVLMSLLVPSKSPEQLSAAATGIGTSGGGATGSRTGTTGASGTGDPNAAPAVGAGASTCEGDQIPGDPYSPPCMAFEGDNGGETSTGVTGTEIRVSFRVLDEKGFQQTLAELAGATLTDTPADIRRTVEALAEYFNNTFQFYGRRLVIDFYEGVGSNTQELLGKGRDRAEADAETVGSMGVFADLSATSEPYADALARRGVVGFGTPYLSRAWHDQRGPFMWSLATNGTEVAEFASEFAAKRLAGGNADYAGGGLQGRPRIIATMAPENSWYQESVQAARARFEAISGQPSGPNYQYVLDLGTMSNQAANLVPRLKADRSAPSAAWRQATSARSHARGWHHSTNRATTASTTSAMEAATPSAAREVTALSAMPQGTMCEKYARSGSTLRAKPCIVRPRTLRTPIAAILRSCTQTPG